MKGRGGRGLGEVRGGREELEGGKAREGGVTTARTTVGVYTSTRRAPHTHNFGTREPALMYALRGTQNETTAWPPKPR